MAAPARPESAVTIGTSYVVTGDGDAGRLTVTCDNVTPTGTIDVENGTMQSMSLVHGGGTLTLSSAAQLYTTSNVFVGGETDTTAGALTINPGEAELSEARNIDSRTIADLGNLVLGNATAAGTAMIDLFDLVGFGALLRDEDHAG